MTAVYDEVEIEDMDWNADAKGFYYPCPCGDKFFVALADLLEGEDLARCPGCSLIIRVICDTDVLEERYASS